MGERLYGLDLFSGIGGLAKALEPYVRAVAYCEIDTYARGVLLSRMLDGQLDVAPIWDDVQSLRGVMLPRIDIIYGGFPCQDISVAGLGIGLDGKRSGLFFEIMRLAKEIKPKFLFLENVPAIRTRGLDRVVQELTEAGYDCRWTMLSAAEVGANHKRERWFLLAHANHSRLERRIGEIVPERSGERPLGTSGSSVADAKSERRREAGQLRCHESAQRIAGRGKKNLANSECERRPGEGCPITRETISGGSPTWFTGSSWWAIEPNVGRVANGISNRMDKLKCLGNAVVPEQAQKAFEILMGIYFLPAN